MQPRRPLRRQAFFNADFNQSTDNIDGASSGSGGVVGNCNTNWNGSITDTSPILEFEADGEAFFFGDLDTQQNEVVTISNEASVNQEILGAFVAIIAAFNSGGIDNPGVTIQGVDDLLTLFNTTAADRDSTTQIATDSGGQDNVFPDIGVDVPIRVFGHQIAFQVAPPIGAGGTTGLEGGGRGTFLF